MRDIGVLLTVKTAALSKVHTYLEVAVSMGGVKTGREAARKDHSPEPLQVFLLRNPETRC